MDPEKEINLLDVVREVKIRVQRARLWSKPRGHDFQGQLSENPKSEYRNPKQTQMFEIRMTKTKEAPG